MRAMYNYIDQEQPYNYNYIAWLESRGPCFIRFTSAAPDNFEFDDSDCYKNRSLPASFNNIVTRRAIDTH